MPDTNGVPESKVVVGYIDPIQFDKLNLDGIFGGGSAIAAACGQADGQASDGPTVTVTLPAPEGVHVPQLLSKSPLAVAPVTREHARQVARQIMADLSELPINAQAADLISLALTVLHFTGE